MSTNPTTVSPPIEITGLSISSCVSAIAEGKVPQNLVVKVIGGTSFDDFNSMWAEYSQRYWSGSMLRARGVFFTFVEQGRIDQPRLRNEEPPDSSKGIWKIGSRSLQTEAVQKFLGTSESFLKIGVGERNEMIDHLPNDVVIAFRTAIAVGGLKPLIPDFQEVTASLSEPEIAKRIKGRLMEYFQATTEFTPPEAYSEILFLLQDHILSQGQPKPRPAPIDARTVKHSQYRPAIKLPGSDD